MIQMQAMPRLHPVNRLDIPPPIPITKDGTSLANSMDAFITKVELEFRTPLQTQKLKSTSQRLQDQFREKLDNSDICMLPSYSDALPSGDEKGEYLAADVGGSWLRIARVRLHGRPQGKKDATEIVRLWRYTITEDVRLLPGTRFFDWMGRKIWECLVEESSKGLRERAPFHVMGLAWSFPLDHKSRERAKLLQMGKNFNATEGLLGADLGQLISDACWKQGIDVRVHGIVNDGSASLLSQMYMDAEASMAVILGTGLNAAIHLPAATFPSQKLPLSATHSRAGSDSPDVLVNTELSMFGKGALSITGWDETLKLAHPRPDFQPLELITSGRYLGELVRLIAVKAIEQSGLFDGEMPEHFGPYELATSTIATIEADSPLTSDTGRLRFDNEHTLPSGRAYTNEEMEALRRIVVCVSDRASAYMATAIHALWSLKQSSTSHTSVNGGCHDDSSAASISCLGSIIGKYPRFGDRVQMWLDRLTADDSISLRLDMTDEGEGALLGAAVSVALGEQDANG